jgi:hypothetical protein
VALWIVDNSSSVPVGMEIIAHRPSTELHLGTTVWSEHSG